MKEKCIIFGASTRGIYAQDKLKNIFDIVAFSDNDAEKWGTSINGIKIISPDKLRNLNYKIFIASQYDNEIISQLKCMGINNYEIFSSSIEFVFKRIAEKEIKITELYALQTFGGNGDGMERFYKNKIKELDVWEIEETFKGRLEENLPEANIKITDSFEEIKKTLKRYNMILMDNPMGIFDGHCEHFDMFMESFQVMQDQCIVILDIMPNLKDIDDKFNYICNSNHLLIRKLFYRAQDPLNLSIEEIMRTYREISNLNGYNIEWYFTEERSGDFIQYLVLNLKRI